jgi:hypothetical protein
MASGEKIAADREGDPGGLCREDLRSGLRWFVVI